MARSPNYPGIALSDAIDRIRKLHAKAHTHKVDAETMAKAAGYGGLNGAALTVLSALKKYGLLEEIGKELRVSPDAMTIIADSVESKSRREAIQRAAFSPTLFDEMRKQFPGSVPSDELVRSYLIKKGFIAGSVDGVIRAFRETMQLVSEEGLGYTSGTQYDADAMLEELKSEPSTPVKPPVVLPPQPPQGTVEIGAYPVAKNCIVRLHATAPLTQSAVEALIKQLQLGVELGLYPEDSTHK